MYPKKDIFNDSVFDVNARPWEWAMEPFKVINGVYFVGNYKASTHLIDTGKGLILVDPGYFKPLYLVIDSIYKLGFNPKDIKYIVNTHWHGDHTEATKYLAHMCNAKTMIGEFDAPYLEDFNKFDSRYEGEFFKPDILIKDGDTLELGNIKMEFMLTPGHTKGVISFFFNVEENGKTYRVGMFGGAGPKSLFLELDETAYPEAGNDYVKSIDKLLKEKVDVMLGNHCWNNNTDERAKLITKDFNPFIDDKEWGKFLNFCKERYYKKLEELKNK